MVLVSFLSENRTKPRDCIWESPNSMICVTWCENTNGKSLQFCIKKIIPFIPALVNTDAQALKESQKSSGREYFMYSSMLLLIAFNQQFTKYFNSMEAAVSPKLWCCPFMSLLSRPASMETVQALVFWFHRFGICKSYWLRIPPENLFQVTNVKIGSL